METLVYKIAERKEFETAMGAGRFKGAPVDLADGFIHFSTARQLRETGRRHFATADDLLLVAVETAALGDALKFEPSRGGDLFPHLYGPMPTSCVAWTIPLARDDSRELIFPDYIP